MTLEFFNYNIMNFRHFSYSKTIFSKQNSNIATYKKYNEFHFSFSREANRARISFVSDNTSQYKSLARFGSYSGLRCQRKSHAWDSMAQRWGIDWPQSFGLKVQLFEFSRFLYALLNWTNLRNSEKKSWKERALDYTY